MYIKTFPKEHACILSEVTQKLGFKCSMQPHSDGRRITIFIFRASKEELEVIWECFKEEFERIIG